MIKNIKNDSLILLIFLSVMILELVTLFIVGRICYKVNKEQKGLKEIAGELCSMKRTK